VLLSRVLVDEVVPFGESSSEDEAWGGEDLVGSTGRSGEVARGEGRQGGGVGEVGRRSVWSREMLLVERRGASSREELEGLGRRYVGLTLVVGGMLLEG